MLSIPAGIDGGKQMLGGGRAKNALFHEARGVADASDVVAPALRSGKIVKVNAAEHDAGVGWGRAPKADMPVHAGCGGPHPSARDSISNGCLEHYPRNLF